VTSLMTTWARIEARSYVEALLLLEQLTELPSTLVQLGEDEWTIYIAADAPEVPELIYGCGVERSRVSFLVESDQPLARDSDAARPWRYDQDEVRGRR
jgi:hypothetical protein